MKNTVLIVDDERDLLALLASILRKAGLTVLEAVGAAEAIAICEDPEVTVDLILSDFQMPGMSGLELADHVVSLRPNIRVILMSANFSRLETIAARGFEFIGKPFAFEDFVSRITECLSEESCLGRQL